MLARLRHFVSTTVCYGLTAVLFALAFWQQPNVPLTDQPVYASQVEPYVPKPEATAKSIHTGVPIRIVIPALFLDIPVLDGPYDSASRTWEISALNAHFALPSVVANDYGGNTLIYGHNNSKVFGLVKLLSEGDEVVVYTNNNLRFRYVLQDSEVLKPNDTTIFNYQGPPTLTIQTCTGNWDELRELSHFSFDSVEPA